MITTKSFLITTILTILTVAAIIVPYAAAQTPPLESPNATTTSDDDTTTTITPTSLGKVTIPITKSEQIIIDLPIKPDSKITIVPIK